MRAALDALRCHFPPDKAKPVNDQVRYRLVRSDPPTAADVVPHCLEPHFDRQRWRTGDPAEAVPYTGLSVLNTAARARKLRDGIPALRDRVVATGTLPEGLTLQVSSGHRVWWPKPSVTWFWEVDRDAVAGCFEVLADQG